MALRQIGLIESYDGLIGVLRTRLAAVGATCEAVSDLAGLTTTHISKLVNPARSKILGRISLTVLLQALGIRLVAVVDDEEYAPLRARLPQAKFHRWKLDELPVDGGEVKTTPRAMKISVDELGGLPAIARVSKLRAVTIVPVKEKPPENATMVTKPRRRVRPSEGLAGAI